VPTEGGAAGEKKGEFGGFGGSSDSESDSEYQASHTDGVGRLPAVLQSFEILADMPGVKALITGDADEKRERLEAAVAADPEDETAAAELETCVRSRPFSAPLAPTSGSRVLVCSCGSPI
jgi:hypothetical protein